MTTHSLPRRIAGAIAVLVFVHAFYGWFYGSFIPGLGL